MSKTFDIIIVGGGLVGTTLALALAHTPWRIALIEAHTPAQQTQASNDMRAIALSYASQQIFNKLGLWEKVAHVATPIEKIHVSEQKRFGTTLLEAAAIQLNAFGYVVLIPLLYNALQQQLALQDHITLFRPAQVTQVKYDSPIWELTVNNEVLRTSLLVAADGDRSFIRNALKLPAKETPYQQTAIVTNASVSKPHKNIAYERFTAQGTLAILPLQEQRVAIIWATATTHAETMLNKNDEEYLDTIQKLIGYRLGKLSALGKRQSYPLREVHADQQTLPGLVLLGNAAHALHPIAAQGFNLGLRDVDALANLLSKATNLTDDSLLQAYLSKRHDDQVSTQRFTHSLVKLFAPQLFPLPHLRGLGLFIFDLMPIVKQEFCWARIGTPL